MSRCPPCNGAFPGGGNRERGVPTRMMHLAAVTISAVLAIAGPTARVLALSGTWVSRGAEKKGEGSLFVQAFGADPAAQKDASPLAHVAQGKGIPPMLVLHSGSDSGSRNEQGQAFVAALKKAGREEMVSGASAQPGRR
jgi:hypothetical protein